MQTHTSFYSAIETVKSHLENQLIGKVKNLT